MTPEEIVAARLQDISDVTAAVGARIYMLKLPQRPTLPAIRLQMISDEGDYHQRGRGGVNTTRVQIDVFAGESLGGDTYQIANDVLDAIKGDGKGPNATGLEGWIGSIGTPPVYVKGAFRAGRSEVYEADELREVRARQDYLIKWAESGS